MAAFARRAKRDPLAVRVVGTTSGQGAGRCSGCTRRRSVKGCRLASSLTWSASDGPTFNSRTRSIRRAPSRSRRSLPVDFVDYLPFDTRGDASAVLDALKPTALVFSKLDVWPVLVSEASRRGVRLGLISGTVSDVSSRRGLIATALLGECYEVLDRVGAASDADAERIIALGTERDRVDCYR